MFRKSLIASNLILPLLLLGRAAAADPLPPAAEWLSPEAALVLEVSHPRAVLDLATDPKIVETVTASPPYKQATSQPGFKQFLAVVNFLESKLDADWKTIVGKILGGGVTVAVGPGEKVVLMIDTEDPEMLEDLHDTILFFRKTDAQNKGEPDQVHSAEYRGLTGWSFGPNESHAIVGNRLIVTNKPEALKEIADRRAEPGGASIANTPAYQKAKQAAGPDVDASLYVNMGVLRHVPGLEDALKGNDNPLGVLLFAGLQEALRNATWLSLGVDVEEDGLAVQATTDGAAGAAEGAARFALPDKKGSGAMPNLHVPRQIAAASLYRDLHGFYAAKDDLFPERTSGLIFFENMMGIFFTGRDLTEEVLAETEPEVRLVVAEQEYDPAVGTPAVRLPAFAAVFRMKHPEKFSRVVEEAWQKAIGLVNFTRGQQALAGLIIDRPIRDDVKYTTAAFSAPESGERTGLEMRYNFQPSLAMPGEYLILSSSSGLAGDLIDALAAEKAAGTRPVEGTHSLVEVDGGQLASILDANREALIRQNMVEKGNSRQQAETQVGLLLTVLRCVAGLKLDMGSHGGEFQAAAELKLQK